MKMSTKLIKIIDSVRTWSDFTCSPDHCLVIKELKLKIRVTEKCQLLCQSTCLPHAVPPLGCTMTGISKFCPNLWGISGLREQIDLNKRSLPRPKTTTAWKIIPHRSKIGKNWNNSQWVPLHWFFKNWFLLMWKQLYNNYIQTHLT